MFVSTGIIIIITATALLILLRFADSLEEEIRMLETSMESARMYNEALEQRTAKIRRLRHDTIGLLQAIENVGKKDGFVNNGADRGGSVSSFGMPLLDAIAELKTEQCLENNIGFEIRCENIATIKNDRLPDETDLCLLVQNMLENAYEANLRIPEKEKRAMSLDVSAGEEELRIAVSNRLRKNENPTFSTRKARPELHGIGTKVIDEIIRKYEGRKIVTQDERKNKLTIEAVLHAT